jgi:hypothetical protein
MPLTRPNLSQIRTAISEFTDPIVLLNKDSTLANVDIGFIINRDGGTSSNAAIIWDETDDQFALALTSDTGSVNANVSVTEYANLKVNSITVDGYVNGNLVPSANVAYSLGSETQWWKDLYLSGGTIYVGGQSASVDTDGVWSFTTGSSTNVILGTNSSISGNISVTGVVSQGTSEYVTNQYVLTGTTTDDTETEIFINNVSNYRIPVSSGTTISYQVDIVAKRTDVSGQGASWNLRGIADNSSGTTIDIGEIYEIIIADDNGNLAVDARSDNTTNSINIYVNGTTGKNYKWVAMVKTIEVSQ